MNDIVFAGRAADDGVHSHRGWEVIVPSVRGELFAGGVAYAYKRGDVVIVPRQLAHSNAGEQCVRMENALIPNMGGVAVISGAPAASISWVCARAAEAAEQGEVVVLDGLGALLRAFIVAYCAGNGFSPTVKSLVGEIERNLSDATFSLENCIKSLPLNYDYVRKLFRREVGQTPLEYITARRMSLARDIMLSGVTNRYSNYTVSQIAEMCGYADPLYFSRVFKKYYGVAPSAFMEGR